MADLGINIYRHDQLYLRQVSDLQAEALGEAFPADQPVHGQTNDVVLADSPRELLTRPDVLIAGLLGTRSDVIGFSLALPMAAYDPFQSRPASAIAYVFWTAIQEEMRHRGKIKPLMQAMHRRLKGEEYASMLADVPVNGGLAESVVEAYGDSVVHVGNLPHDSDEEAKARILVSLVDPDLLPH
jgi:hypothetical protein